ncbi:MAG: glycosyltransferase [Ornithinimicrobium sp.]
MSQLPPAQYRAVVRFSVFDPTTPQWRATRSGTFESPEEYRDHLWSKERMRTRMRIFRTWAVPHYQQMAQRHDFRVLVQHSEDLPARYLDDVRDLAAAHDAIRLMPLRGQQAFSETVATHLRLEGRSGPVVMLRVDDDDLISVDLLDQLAPHVTDQHRGWVLSPGYGLAARINSHGLFDFRPWVSPLIAIGQAYTGSFDARRGRLDMPVIRRHRQVHRELPTILDSRSLAWVYVRHPGQDTQVGVDPAQARSAVVRAHRRLPVMESGWAEAIAAFPRLRPDLERAQRRLEAAPRTTG